MKSSTSERLIAMVSAFVAVAIVAVFGIAERTGDAPVVNLGSLEADVRLQFELALRHDLPAYERRVAALEAATAAFDASSHSPADQRLLAEWLQEAIRRTMPGRLKPLPATPQFGASEAEEEETDAHGPNPNPGATPVLLEAAPQSAAPPEIAAAPPAADENSAAGTDIIEPAPPQSPVAAGPIPTLADPPGEAAPAVETPVQVIHASAPSAPATATTVQPTVVTVNLPELRAQIAGYHAGLRDLEAAVTNARDALTLADVARAVSELESLAAQYEFVLLYYQSLTNDERVRVDQPRSPAATARRLAAAVDVAADDPAGGFDPFNSAAATAVNQLRAKLAELAGE
ncbi:MAG: hypothetical protein CMJ58_02665 [Planctomycetaceae bacterium]|nr:hypothetical protein [Planctomycetaceae bacterium]